MQVRRLIQWKISILKRTISIFSCAWLLEATQIFAQATAADSGKEEKSYFLAYVLVLFLIALGVAIVARSGQRAEKPKMIEKELEYRLEKMSGRSQDTQ